MKTKLPAPTLQTLNPKPQTLGIGNSGNEPSCVLAELADILPHAMVADALAIGLGA